MANPNPAQTKISFRQKIALMLSGLFLAVIMLEIGLRLGGFVILSLQEHRNRLTLQKKGTYRIMCLGESTTQNQYPPFLEEILNQRNIGIRFSAIDKGVGGIDTTYILLHLEVNLDKYQPDLVVAMMGINDSGLHIPYEAALTSRSMLFFRSFRIYKLARLLWLHLITKAKEMGFCKTQKTVSLIPRLQYDLGGIGLKTAHAEQDNSAQQAEKIEKVTKPLPQNDTAYVELGRFYRHQGKLTKAEQVLKKAIELNPKNERAYVELGWFYIDHVKLDEAEQTIRKAIELKPKNDIAYVELGRLYRDQGKLDEAEQVLKKAIELNPKNERAYVELGRLYRDQGKLDEAEQVLKKAIELNLKNGIAYVELGRLYIVRGKLTEAEQAFKKAIELNPKNEWAYGGLAIVYEEMNRHSLANAYGKMAESFRKEYYDPITTNNYRKLKQILDKRKIRLVCVQYPMRSIEPLKKIFKEADQDVMFVDNEKAFKDAVRKTSYKEYFNDMFGGDFGHCTEKGNRLLAENIANAILKKIFGK